MTADAFTVARTVQAIEEYLAVRNSDRSTRKVVGEEIESSQLVKLAAALFTVIRNAGCANRGNGKTNGAGGSCGVNFQKIPLL